MDLPRHDSVDVTSDQTRYETGLPIASRTLITCCTASAITARVSACTPGSTVLSSALVHPAAPALLTAIRQLIVASTLHTHRFIRARLLILPIPVVVSIAVVLRHVSSWSST